MMVTQVMLLGLELPSLNWSQRLRLVALASVSLINSILGILALKVINNNMMLQLLCKEFKVLVVLLIIALKHSETYLPQ